MTPYVQAQRHLAVETPLGPDVLLLEKLAGREGISSLYSFQLELLAEAHADVPFEKLLGQLMTVRLRRGDGRERIFSGICARLRQGTGAGGTSAAPTFLRYHAELVPHFWLWTKRQQSRIFQQQTIPEILQVVLQGLDVSFSRLSGRYHPRNYCVQYRETDFAFASRLMEEEGIFYYFDHSAKGEQMVLVDHVSNVTALEAPDDKVTFEQTAGPLEREVIASWEKAQEVVASEYVVRDRSFEIPSNSLEAQSAAHGTVAVGAAQHPLRMAGNSGLVIYEHPGAFANRFDGIDAGGSERPAELQKLFEENQRTVNLRMEEETARSLRVEGSGNCAGLLPGHRFQLEQHARGRGEYLILQVEHTAELEGGYRSDGNGTGFRYQNRFACLPAHMPYRPPRVTLRPRVSGTSTATVSGHEPGEIFTDKYGRVKVLFHWDRAGKIDGNSSCWIRVMQPWAGQGWGAVQLPRVGQEVVVDFLEGNPDRPIILGGVYNSEQMPPYSLPAKREVSGIRSRSHQSSDPEAYNEVRMEDTPNQELFHIQAQKDLSATAENDYTQDVGHDSTVTVGNDASLTVDHNSTTTVNNNATTTVGDDPLTMNLLTTWNHIELDKLTKTVVVGVAHSEAEAIKIEIAPLRFVGVVGAQVHVVGPVLVEKVLGLKYESVTGKSIENVSGNKTVSVGGNLTETVGDGKKNKHLIRNGNFQMETNLDFGVNCQVMQLKCAGSGGHTPEFMLSVSDDQGNGCNISLQTKELQIGANVATGDVLIQGKSITIVAPESVTIQTKSFAVESYVAAQQLAADNMKTNGMGADDVEEFLTAMGTLTDQEVQGIIAAVFPNG